MIHIYHHTDCLTHDPGATHPESPGRIRAILEALQNVPFREQLRYLDAPPGTAAQILLAHAPAHLRHVQELAPVAGHRALDPDTILSPGSLAAALRGVGAACAGVDALLSGSTNHAFCLTRPPGHHATAARAMGFCVFNQVAIAALYAQQAHGLQRIAVVDFDVHHGNGTQDILRERAGLLYVSTHQSPLYPGSGTPDENLPGNIHNVPLPAGTGDSQYRALFTTQILPELEQFRPQLLLVSAGFDAHRLDPLAGINLVDATYAWLGGELRKVAAIHAGNRLLSVLEGGYNLQVLGASVAAYLGGTLT